jgi:hypothetical protein
MIDLSDDEEEKLPQPYFEIKDNGAGIHPSLMKDALTSFGQSLNAEQKGIKSEFQLSEHGIGLKLNGLRLAQNVLVISKTNPVNNYGNVIQYLSFGLLST